MEKAASFLSSLLGGGGGAGEEPAGEPAATVASILIYPIKSCRGVSMLVPPEAFHEDQRFGYAPLDAFYQPTEASTQLLPVFSDEQLLEGDATAADFRGQQSGGAFDVEVKLNAKLWVKVWAFKVAGPRARISCPLSLPAPGAAAPPAFKPVECKVWF